MVILNENRLYFITAFIVLVLVSLLVNRFINKKYSGFVILISIALSFYMSQIYIKHYKPYVSLTYYELYNLKKDYSIKNVMINPKVLSGISNYNSRLLQTSGDYATYIKKTHPLLTRLQKELGIKHENPELNQVASISVLVSTLFAYGNPIPYADSIGCLTQNYAQKNIAARGGKNHDFLLLKANRIGCCTDYAYIMSKFLTSYKFKNRYTVISGHVFNEFKIDGSWYIIDANTGIMVTKSFTSSKKNFDVYYLPHLGMMDSPVYRPVLITFREFLSNVICDQKIADALFERYGPENGFNPY